MGEGKNRALKCYVLMNSHSQEEGGYLHKSGTISSQTHPGMDGGEASLPEAHPYLRSYWQEMANGRWTVAKQRIWLPLGSMLQWMAPTAICIRLALIGFSR